MAASALDEIVQAGSRVLVRQIKEWGEILTSFETKNRYGVYADDGREVAYIGEEGGFAGRFLLSPQMRPCTLHVYDAARREIARIEKPFTFYLHEVQLVESGRTIGKVERQLAVLSRRFVVTDARGTRMAEIVSPLLRVWTFRVLVNGREVALISKKWSGLGLESFTDADTFGIEFKARLSDDLKKLLVAATMLVDFTHFEKKR